MIRAKRKPTLGELLATLQAEADYHGQSIVRELDGGARVEYRSRVEGATRRRQLRVTRPGVFPSVVEMQTFAGYGFIPRTAEEAAYTCERDGVVWYTITLTWLVPIVTMPQAELPL